MSSKTLLDRLPTAEEYSLFRETYSETYPVRPLMNAIAAKDREIERLRANAARAVRVLAAVEFDGQACGAIQEATRLLSGADIETAGNPAPKFGAGERVRFIDQALDHAEWVVSRTHDGWVYLYWSADRCHTHFARPEELQRVETEGRQP